MDIRFATIVVAFCLPLRVAAQQNESSPTQDAQAKPEEVLIIGERVQQLRTQMMQAEVNAYDIFNQFNDEKRFMINCSIRQPTGTLLKRQVCDAGFEREAMAAHGRDYFENVRDMLNQFAQGVATPIENTPPMHIPAEAVIASQLQAYHRKMKQVAEQHPEFLEAIKEYSKLQKEYEESTRTGK